MSICSAWPPKVQGDGVNQSQKTGKLYQKPGWNLQKEIPDRCQGSRGKIDGFTG